jgi:serine/threonine-protein kinase
MTTSELGACEWFVWDLQRSNLIERGQLDQLVTDFFKKHRQAEPPVLAQFLIDQGSLSPFQAERLLQGKSQGLVLGPYVLMDALGSGSMGTVYKALSKNDQQEYAVKVLPRRSMWNVRIARRQVRVFEQCRHAAVVPFVDVGTAGGTHYLVWPLVEGQTLEKLVADLGKLPPGVAAHYLLQGAEGLHICHQQGIIHGLLKPSNIMVGYDQQVRLLDLGIGTLLANPEGESLVDTMSTANTLTSGLDCASPESILEPSNRTAAGDQYSLGCVLYFCLTGGYPFAEGTAVEKMMAHQTKEPTPIRELSPEVPDGLVAVADRLMQKAPEARYANLAQLVDALHPWATPPTATVPRPAPAPVKTVLGVGGTASISRSTPEPDVARPPQGSSPQFDRLPAALPTRESLREESQAPAPVPASQPASALPDEEVSTPSFEEYEPISIEQRLGPVGLFVGAVMAASVTWLLTLWMFK